MIDDIIKFLNENKSIPIILGPILAAIITLGIVKIAKPISRNTKQIYNITIRHIKNQWKNLKTNFYKKTPINREETLHILEEVIEITGRQEHLNTELLRILNKILKKETECYNYITSSQYKISNDYHHQLTETIKETTKISNKQKEIENKIEEFNKKIQ